MNALKNSSRLAVDSHLEGKLPLSTLGARRRTWSGALDQPKALTHRSEDGSTASAPVGVPFLLRPTWFRVPLRPIAVQRLLGMLRALARDRPLRDGPGFESHTRATTASTYRTTSDERAGFLSPCPQECVRAIQK